MNQTSLKKVVMILFVFMAFLFAFDLIQPGQIRATDYQQSASWKGTDLGFLPQSDVGYESDYLSFSDIMTYSPDIDLTKKYVIESAYDLFMLSDLSRGANRSTYLSLHYVLGRDIDYYDIVQENITNRFHPIGFLEPFSGTFDGQGYEITNLFFQSILSEEQYNQEYPGLRFFSMFSKISSTGSVKNLGLINPIIIQPIEWGIMDHVATLAGENYGLIENVYYIDTRLETSGLNVEGAFRISGLVSINRGTFRNAYVASPYVRSQAVIDNTSVSPVMYLNLGTAQKLYYDSEIYLDELSGTIYGAGLSTAGFQNPAILTDDWYYNDSYHALANGGGTHQYTLTHIYPILQGLDVSDGKLLIEDAVDLVYFNRLLTVSGAFRAAHYQIIKDIDMNQVSFAAYQAASVGFDGILSSGEVGPASTLYTRELSQGGDQNYHTILNLKITTPTEVGTFTSYAMFASLFGRVENINFVNLSIVTNDISDHTGKTKILVGSIAGLMTGGTIENVHVHGSIDVLSATSPMTKLYAGGLVGEASGTLDHVSTNGSLTQDTQIFDVRAHESASAGMVAHSNGLTVSYAHNAYQVQGMHVTTEASWTTYVGGIIGNGDVITMNKIVNSGDMYAHDGLGYIGTLYIGGIIGQQINQFGLVEQVYNDADIYVDLNRPISVYGSGYGFVDGTNQDLEALYQYQALTNNGQIFIQPINGNLYTPAELALFDIQLAGLMITDGIDATYQGLFNEADHVQDLSLVHRFAGVADLRNSTLSSVIQAYNQGTISFTTDNVLTQPTMMVSGVLLGDNLDVIHLRNEASIDVVISDTASVSGSLYVMGVMEDVSQNMTAEDLFNGGDLSVIANPALTMDLDVFTSGVMHSIENSNYLSDNHISTTSIESINGIQGAVHNVLNDGMISVDGVFSGSVRASGIAMINQSLVTSAFNLSDVYVHADLTGATEEAAAAGLIYLMTGQTAQLKDSANYGEITALVETTNGYAHAAGLVFRNDLNSDLSMISTGSTNKYGKILFSINYGDVYAYNGTVETAYAYASETRSKAAGIFGMGFLSVINTINYGNIHGKYLAAGTIGFIPFNRFGTYGPDQVYIANNINYGMIRAITNYDTDFVIDMYSVPTRTVYNAYGSFIGKFHTGTLTWEFVSISPTAIYGLDDIEFGYATNFDERVDMIGNNPTTTVDPSLYDSSAPGNEAIIAVVEKLATVKPTDTSVSPFAPKLFGSPPQHPLYSTNIQSYLMDDSLDGIFSTNYIFRQLPVRTTGTDQYLKGYFAFIERDKANSDLLTRLETYKGSTYFGLYVLAPSDGIGNGIFIPNHIELDPMNPYTVSGFDLTWQGDVVTPDTILYKLIRGMNQLETTYGTTIYDMQIVQTDASGNPVSGGLALSKPLIDDERGLITFYLPSNASILDSVASNQVATTSFVEVSPGVEGARKVPDYYDDVAAEWIYKWVGTHKKVGDAYVEIGPYDSAGTRSISFSGGMQTTEYYRSNRILVPVYARSSVSTEGTLPLSFVHTHTDHQYYIQGNPNSGNFRYEGTGYVVSNATTTAAGYGPYRFVTHPNPGTNLLPYYINGTYEYVGPNPEAVTYVRTDPGSMTIFDDAGIYFKANTDASSYQVAQGASFTFGGSDITTLSTVPLAYGIYDVIYADPSGDIIDKLEYHYGSVRVFSENYDAGDPLTYRDYEIRIIRAAEQYLDSLEAATMNGNNAIPAYSDFRDITISEMIHYELDDPQGILSLSYRILNVSPGYDVLPLITVTDLSTMQTVDPTLYKLEEGLVVNDNAFNNLTGAWGLGDVTFDFMVTDRLPSGDYLLTLELITGEVAEVNFSKMESSNGMITTLVHEDELLSASGNAFTSNIKYGLYYVAEDARTFGVDFTNLETLINVYEDDIDNGLIPSYLDQFAISPFATLSSVELTSVTMLDSYRHRYTITYEITAEDGTPYTYVHYLDEYEIQTAPDHVYYNGGELDQPLSTIMIPYDDAPSVRVELNVSDAYLFDENALVLTPTFIESNGYGLAVLGEDYFLSYLDQVGYQIDLNFDTPIGTYQINASFVQEVVLWGQTISWDYAFDMIELIKLENDQSKLENIYFVSDTLFSGFNTIVDYQEVTEQSYINYLTYPETRPMSVLPTTGIYYGDYASYDTYWIIGQVQRTDLSVYSPTFVLPDFAIIRRVVDNENIGPEFQSTNLYYDFSIADTSFNYVHYRVYAQDYATNPDNYTDYYIAVQDVTNNIKFNLTVVNDTDTLFERVHVKVNICRVEEGETCGFADFLYQMSVFSYYDEDTDSYSNNQFQTSAYGTYLVYVDLPLGYTFDITLQSSSIDGSSFYLEDSILPRKYYVTVTIIEEPHTPDWGHEKKETYQPAVLPLDEFYTYQSGQMFTYGGITWLVQEGYTYTYDALTPPGSQADLGIRDISETWHAYSTYLPGDIVSYLDTSYLVKDVLASGVIPDVTSVTNNLYFEISDLWLSYNVYEVGYIVLHNGVYYEAMIQNQNVDPEFNHGIGEAWNIVTP